MVGVMSNNGEHFSTSQLNMLLRCEWQYRCRYCLGMVRPPSAALSLGSAFHDGTLFSLARKIDSGKDLPTPEVVEVAITGLENRKDETEWDQPFGEVKDELPRLIECFQEEAAPTIEPVAVEEKVEVGFKETDWTFLAYLDVREKDGTVMDIKTAKRSWPASRILTEFQPLAYTVTEPGESKFRFDVAVRTKKPKMQSLERTVKTGEKAAFLGLIAAAQGKAEMLKADPDRALPTGYGGNLCSKKYCGFYADCQARWNLNIKD